MTANRWQTATPEALAALVAEASGRAGDHEAEAALTWEKWNPRHVDFYTRRGADVGPLVERCGSAVLAFWTDDAGGYAFRIDRSAFRGFHMAFKRLDNRKPGTFPTGVS
jgi:hypothetical protein